MVGGLLGIAMFAVGFLKWLELGDGEQEQKYAGFAFGMPTTAVIGLSLAAGLIAFLGAIERRPGRGVPSAIPAGLAATSLLLAIGVYLGKGSISPDVGSEVGVQTGLIVGMIVALLQTAVLGMVLASRRDERADQSSRARWNGESARNSMTFRYWFSRSLGGCGTETSGVILG